MSLINKLRPGRGASRVENFFGEVRAFNLDQNPPYITVAVLGTGEERRIGLNQGIAFKPNEKGYERPGLEAFTKGKSKTEIGGTLMIESATYDPKSAIWQARWISTALKTPDQGRVAVLTECKVSPLIKPEGGGNAWRRLDALDSAKAERVNSMEGFDAAIREAIEARNGALVRLHTVDADGKDAYEAFSVSGGRGASIEERIQNAFNTKNEKFAALRAAFAEGLVGEGDTVEVVPMSSAFFGRESATKGNLDNNFIAATDEGRQYSRGFTSALVTLHYYEGSDDLFVANALPLDGARAQFSRVGQSFDPKAAQAEAGPPAHEGEAASAGDDDLPPEMDLEQAMGQAPAPASRSALPGM